LTTAPNASHKTMSTNQKEKQKGPRDKDKRKHSNSLSVKYRESTFQITWFPCDHCHSPENNKPDSKPYAKHIERGNEHRASTP